jgi:hypothetical protein
LNETLSLSLEKISSDRAKVIYRIFDERGVVRGSVSVPPEGEGDLLAHWNGPSAKSKEPAADLAQKRKAIL